MIVLKHEHGRQPSCEGPKKLLVQSVGQGEDVGIKMVSAFAMTWDEFCEETNRIETDQPDLSYQMVCVKAGVKCQEEARKFLFSLVQM